MYNESCDKLKKNDNMEVKYVWIAQDSGFSLIRMTLIINCRLSNCVNLWARKKVKELDLLK